MVKTKKTKIYAKQIRKISKKEGYKKSKAIMDVLEDSDKEELRKTNYICYDDLIEFPKPCLFTLERLKEIIKEAEKYQKNDGKGMLLGIEIKFDMKNMNPKLKKILKKNSGRKFMATKTKVMK